MNTNPTTETVTLRQRAEKKLENSTSPNDASHSEAKTLRLLHELHVHQIELEMQNEELRAARAET